MRSSQGPSADRAGRASTDWRHSSVISTLIRRHMRGFFEGESLC